jgi:hypothetical protein
MTTVQNPIAEEGESVGAGPFMSPKDLYLSLGTKPALANGVSAINSIFLERDIGRQTSHISLPAEMAEPESSIVVKVEDVDVEANTPASISGMPEKTT